jgi:hypothetical protein
MAYGLRYQSNFYNVFRTLCSVKIYKKDYVGAVTNIRTSSVEITANYQNDKTPVIGKGASVVIIADSTALSYLEDLLLSYERQFMCIIEYNEEEAFRGYSICDLNERQILPFAAITVQFTDYLHRLTGEYATCLKVQANSTDLLTLLTEYLNLTTFALPLYINSTLFESNMNQGATDTFLPQIRIQNALFYVNLWQYDNVYDAVNKALAPFGAYLYSQGGKWIIERQEDITRTGNWVKYDGTGVASVASLKQSINKQAGDFDYVNCSGVIEYDSGLHTLTIRLRDKLLDSIVYNNYTIAMLSTAEVTPSSLPYRTWYKNENIPAPTVGENFRNFISTWMRFQSSDQSYGIYYNFQIQFNLDSDDTTSLNVEYKMSTDRQNTDIFKVRMHFLLRLDGGPWDGYYLQVTQSVGAGTILVLYPGTGTTHSADPYYWCANSQVLDVYEDGNLEWSIFKTFDFNNMQVKKYRPGSSIYYDIYDNLDSLLGYPEYQKLTIMFMTPWFTNTSKEDFSHRHLIVSPYGVYLGDIKVNVSTKEVNNNIQYYLNESFVKTEELDLDLFDLPNINYSNGMLEADGLTLTEGWTSENSPSFPIPLYEIFAKAKFRKYGRTIHRLKGTIRCDKILKIFALLTDNNLTNESAEIITFLLNGFTWNLNDGTYQISAEEYTEEEIQVETVGNDADGEPVPPGHDYPAAPLNFTGSQITLGGGIRLTWDASPGGIGYVVQRKPMWWFYNSSWVQEWRTIKFGGSELTIDDLIQNEGGVLTDDFVITYRICAYNDKGQGVWSNEIQVRWYSA